MVNEIAQLIKLQDYITRYDWDTYRYPSQYIRLKRENWNKLHEKWSQPVQVKKEILAPLEKESRFAKWKGKVTKRKELPKEGEIQENEIELPKTEQGLKQYFLDEMLKFQLKWATSTVTDTSFMNKRYKDDSKLRYFLQRFPDTYLVMYYPVFTIKKAPIDAEVILISPIGIEIIYLMEEQPSSVIIAGDERTWTIEFDHRQTKRLSPLIALKRTEQIVKSILNKHDIEFDVRKTILSKTNNIVFLSEPYNTKIIGTNEYDNWLLQKRKLNAPLKSTQLKASEVLLKHCQTTSVRRPEWENDSNSFKIVGEEL